MKVRHSRFSVGVILFALAMLPTMAQERAAQIREKLLNRNLHSVIVVSHRADWRNFLRIRWKLSRARFAWGSMSLNSIYSGRKMEN